MNLSRRNALKGISLGCGFYVLSPLSRMLADQVSGVNRGTQRFVFLVKSSGMTPAHIVPETLQEQFIDRKKGFISGEGYTSGDQLKNITQRQEISLKNQKLDIHMKSLEPFKDKLTIVQGLSGQMVSGGHMSKYGAMSCVKDLRAETIDNMMCKLFPGVFNHLGLSTVARTMGSGYIDSVCYPEISASHNKQLPFHGSPTQAFNSLFSSVAQGDAKQEFKAFGGLYDYLKEDIQRLQKNVVQQEKEKLQLHIESIEELHRQQQSLLKMEKEVRLGKPEYTEKYKSTSVEDRIDAHCAIASGALIAGLTNVVTVRMDGLGTGYSKLGFSGINVHGIGHGGTPEGAKSPDHARSLIRQFHIEKIAEMATKLQKVPEGNGTMLDNTTFIYFSDVGDKHHASNKEWPFLVLGNMGGKLKCGSYLHYPHKGNKGHHTIAGMWMTLLNAAGKEVKHFGMKDKDVAPEDQSGPLSELMS